MNQDEMLQLILQKLVSLEQGQKSLEQGQKSLEQGQITLREELKSEIQANRQAIMELQTELREAIRFYDFKLLEHEKRLFKLES